MLAILFAIRERLCFLRASIIRRVAWMLQTGSYEIDQGVAIGRYGGTTERRRIEALAAINENPQARAADIRLVELVFCGASQRNDGGLTLDDVVFRPAFAHDAQTVESLDLFDALIVRDTCHLPARFCLCIRYRVARLHRFAHTLLRQQLGATDFPIALVCSSLPRHG